MLCAARATSPPLMGRSATHTPASPRAGTPTKDSPLSPSCSTCDLSLLPAATPVTNLSGAPRTLPDGVSCVRPDPPPPWAVSVHPGHRGGPIGARVARHTQCRVGRVGEKGKDAELEPNWLRPGESSTDMACSASLPFSHPDRIQMRVCHSGG